MLKRHRLVWLIAVSCCAAGAAAFVPLYELRNDPLPRLATLFEVAAFLQPLPYIAAGVLAFTQRRRPNVLWYTLAAVVVCGGYGWWWISDLPGVRDWENAPTTRHALGNIAPDLEGWLGAGWALAWPAVVAFVVGGATLVGRAMSNRPNRRPEVITAQV